MTDHILTGGSVTAETDPHELFHAFMGQQQQLGREYRDLRQRLQAAEVANPRLAITEAQLFSRFAGKVAEGDPNALSPRTLPTPQTISEALYDAAIIHECIRMGDFVELFTHSATVNHGGGLEKRRERVFAHPCYYGHWMERALAGGTPVAIELKSAVYSTRHTFGQIAPMKDIPVLDALAVLSQDEKDLIIMVIHRGSQTGPVALELDPGRFPADLEVKVMTLAGKTMYDRNTLEEPERIKPQGSVVKLENGTGRITLPPYSLTRLTFQRAVER